MQQFEQLSQRRLRLGLLTLALGLAALYLLTMSGHLYAGDEETLYYVTEGLVEGRGFSISPAVPLANRSPGVDGRLYSRYPVGQAVAAVPLYLAGKLAALAAPPAIRPFITRMYVHTFNIWVTVLLCVVLAAAGLLFGARPGGALMVALLLGLSSMYWVYTRTFFAEPLTALLTLLSFYAITRHAVGGERRWLLISGCAAGLALTVKPHAVLAWPALALYLVLSLGWPEQRWQRPGRRWLERRGRRVLYGLAAWLAGWLPAVTLQLLYNQLIFGGPLTSGYTYEGQGSLDVPLYIGLYGLIFSSGKGIIFYTPLVVAGIVALRTLARAARWAAWSIGLMLLIHLLVFGQHSYWYGGGSWGPRFMLLVLPFMLLPLAPWLNAPTSAMRRQRRLVAGLLALAGMLVQLIGLWTNFDTPIVATDDTRRFYVPWASPIVQQAQLARDRWQLWRPALLPASGSAVLLAGYSFAGLEQQRQPGSALPLRAQPLMIFSVRPQGSADLLLDVTTELTTTVAASWDGVPIAEQADQPGAPAGWRRVRLQLPAGAGRHELALQITRTVGAPEASSLPLVQELQLLEGGQPLQLVLRPYIPPMPEAPLRRWQWFHLPNIPHLCDLWLWYLYSSGLPAGQALLLAAPLLLLAFALLGGALLCLWRLRRLARSQPAGPIT